ncbi:hypothetical protein [Actinospica robiniae]|uniref:hypothetical protein n=1 Tax=Actinospica robiniae TaxID=304901 RepID=UPI00042A72F6|nr:hypothetical protein [Actinospica robiniae]
MTLSRTRALSGLCALLAACAAVFTAAPAQAGTAVLTTSAGAVAVGDSLSTVGSTTFKFGFNNSITLACGKVGVVAQTATNPTSPGSAALKIVQLGVSGCTLSGTTDTLQSVTLSGTGVAVVSDGSPLKLTVTAITVVIGLNNGIGTFDCDFATNSALSPIVGIIVNPGGGGTGGSITFTNQTVHLLGGTSFCGSSGLFNGVFTTPLDGALPVSVN